MESKEIQVPKPAKKSNSKYIALSGIDTADGQRFEIGEEVSGLKPAEISALLEMEAIEEVK